MQLPSTQLTTEIGNRWFRTVAHACTLALTPPMGWNSYDTFGDSVTEEETLATITATRANSGEVLCPHSAVGVKVAADHLGATPMITLATAHPAKFPDAVEYATGLRPGLPNRMADLYDRQERVTQVANDLGTVEDLIRGRRRT